MTDETEIAVAEQNALGITRIRIEHRSHDAERILDIRGLDEGGEELANATLRTGMVMYGADVPEELQAGTELTLVVNDVNATFVSPDRVPHTELEPYESQLASFVRLSAVSTAIAAEAAIRFTPRDGEVALVAQSCNGGYFPTANGNPSSCCVDGAEMWHKIAAGANLNKLAWRTIGNTCRDSAGNTGCTGSGCAWGPCGARINVVSGTNTASATVYTPASIPTVCGRDGNGNATGGAYELPEPYTAQSLRPGVTATCPFTECDLADGRPGPGFWLTITATCTNYSSTGYVRWTDRYGVNHDVACNYNGTPFASQTFWAQDVDTKTITQGYSPTQPMVKFDGLTGGGCTGTPGCTGSWTTDTTISGSFSI